MTAIDTGGVSMTWAHGPVVTRRRLGRELKALRDGAGMKLEDVAKSLECSTSKISRLENGKGIPRVRDVRDMLAAYGVTDPGVRDRLETWALTGRQQPMWWHDYAEVLSPATATYVELEWDAVRVRAYECYIVHGLLQTREYARGILRNAYGGSRSAVEIERLLEVRMRRQDALAPEHGLEFRCLLDESTLYRVVESSAVQRDQLEHLRALTETGHVDLRILPFAAGLQPDGRDSFATIEFGADVAPSSVYLERPGAAGDFVTDPAEVARYERALGVLADAAVSPAESISLIERALGFLDTT